jgi:hypothetical protein
MKKQEANLSMVCFLFANALPLPRGVCLLKLVKGIYP